MVALALFLRKNMPRMNEKGKLRPAKRIPLWHYDNLCSYCLFFETHNVPGRLLNGNCTHHKEWIDNASLTTCSDMSKQTLLHHGIYRLSSKPHGTLIYTRREAKIRTRLFLIKNQSGKKGSRPGNF
jgi:hypothetical protein